MAEFFPRVPDELWPDGATRASNQPELVFRALLEKALADTSWTVIQNLLVQDPDRVGTREIDFLVIDPTRGMIVIEVKGGDYRFSAEHGWHRVVRDKIRIDHRGAPKQAVGSMHALVRAMSKHAMHDAKKPPYLHGWLVALVDAEVLPEPTRKHALKDEDAPDEALPLEIREHILDAAKCRNPAVLRGEIESLFQALAQRYPEMPLGAESCVAQLVARFLLPSTRTQLGVRDEIGNARLVESDFLRPVRSIMNAAHGIDRVSIDGYPGTGKTYAALYRARRDLAQKRRTLVLCFNIPLAAALTARLHAHPVRNDTSLDEIRARECVVARFYALAAAAAHGRCEIPADENTPEYFDALLTALERAAHAGDFGHFDSIIVDEGQDFSPAMMRVLDALCANPRTRVAFFYDRNQVLYEATPDAELRARFGQPLQLRENLRNSVTISEFLKSLNPARMEEFTSPPSMRLGQTVVVAEYAHGDIAAQRGAIESIVRHLIDEEDVRAEDIALISPFKYERTVLAGWGEIAGIPLLPLERAVRREDTDPPCLRHETLHRFKGLEAAAVILHDVAGASANVEYEAILTACSRAQHALYVLRSDNYAGGAALPVQGTLPS
jgi:hypothetical protein